MEPPLRAQGLPREFRFVAEACNTMDDFEKELKEGFLQEAEQMLLDAEQCFLDLESLTSAAGSGNSAVLEKIFRLAHSLKGSARAVGFEDMGHFTHELENLLVKLKNGNLAITSPVVTLLLRCNDHLRGMVTTLKGNLSATVDSSALLEEIARCLSGPFRETATAQPAIAPPAPPAAQLEEPIEDVLEFSPKPAQAPPQQQAHGTAEEAIRVSLKRLDVLMNYIGELVILQTVLNQHKSQIDSPLLQRTVGQIGKITKDIQGISMSLRMIPLKPTFQKLHRTLRDTAKSLGKEVQLETSGDETEMDKTVLDRLGDPLVHLIRNAADHGIESTETRLQAGKSATGTVRIRAFHQGDRVIIEVSDDGGGICAETVRKKAVERGILSPGQEISDKAAHELVFHPGFSTKAEVTDISGRGVGLDVVKHNIESLQGEVQIDTVKGQGTTFRILLPLTLAIIDAMVVRMGDERYVIPLAHIHESVQPVREDVHHLTNVGEVLCLRGENLPLYPLSGVLGRKSKPMAPWDSIALVIRAGDKPFAVLVDDIIGQQQVVIKRLGAELENLKGFSGSSILGDGRAALILDLVELIGKGAAGARRLSPDSTFQYLSGAA